jgi:hypothetical protein
MMLPGKKQPLLARTLTLLALIASAHTVAAQEEPPRKIALKRQYEERVRPLLQKYCIRCHGEKTKTDVHLDNRDGAITPQTVELWTRVKNELDVGAMPPKNEARRPTTAEQELLLTWAGDSLKRYEADNLETGGDTLVRRINQRAYANMIRTLLDVPPSCLDEFPEDGSSFGYDTVGSGLYATTYQCEMYLKSAQRTLDAAISATDTAPTIREVKHSGRKSAQGHLEGKARPLALAMKTLRDDPKRFGPQIFSTIHGGMVQRIVATHFGKKSFAEVTAAGIDWVADPKCADAIMAALKAEADRVKSMQDNVSDFQPLFCWGGGIMDPIGLGPLNLDVVDPGYYTVRARLCLSHAHCPLPIFFSLDDKVFKQFIVYDPLSTPGTYEVKLFLSKGKHRLWLQPANNFINFIDLVNSLYGLKTGRGEYYRFPVYYAGCEMPPNILCAELSMRGPVHDRWPTAATQRIFTRGVKAPPTREYAEEIVLAFMKHAYGGDCDAALARPFVDMVMSHHATEKDFVAAVKYGLAAVLSSPRFLYLHEEKRLDSAQRRPLKNFELARRLAYFLWSDLPDEPLLTSAASGKLSEEKELLAQTRRMLRDSRGRAFREAFTTQWLKIDKLKSIPIAEDRFPAFDAVLLESAREESIAFFSELLDTNASILNFLDSDFVMVNGRLARHYGLRRIVGNEFRRVSLPPGSHRGGVLAQASVLIATSNGMVSSPVRRGAFVMERLLGVSPGTPPPNVDALDKVRQANDDGTPLTPRERLAIHRENQSCARCHNKIDPLGVGLENYDALGSWKARLELQPLVTAPLSPVRQRTEPTRWVERDADVRGTMLDGTPYDGPDELKRQLLKHKARFLRSLAENLTIYALGRGLELSDRAVLDRVCERVAADNYGLATLVEQIVLSDLFRKK